MLNSHPESWNEKTHYGMCGQNCPCCRAVVEEIPLGVCPICWEKLGKTPLPKNY